MIKLKMLRKLLLIFLLIQYCLASIEQVGDTQINIINVDNKLIKQNLIEIQCEYGLDQVFSKTFSTTDDNVSIDIDCPRAVKQYISQEKGFVPEETYVKSIELCESGVTPLWDYDRTRSSSSTSRRLATMDDLLAKRQEFLSTFDKMVNTEQLGCIPSETFYGGLKNETTACNAEGVRYLGWKNWTLTHKIDYDGQTQTCWDIYNTIVKVGDKINFSDVADSPSNVGELFRCFIGKFFL